MVHCNSHEALFFVHAIVGHRNIAAVIQIDCRTDWQKTFSTGHVKVHEYV